MIINKEAKSITEKYLNKVLKKDFGINEKFWENYSIAKEEGLKHLFGKELIIERDILIDTPVSDLIRELRKSDFEAQFKENLKEDWKDKYNTYVNSWIEEEKFSQLTELDKKGLSLINCILSPHVMITNEVQATVEILNAKGKRVQIQEGMKLTRTFKHFLKDEKSVDRLQTLYSQIVNTKKLSGKLCLSIHPLDYLTASVNNSGWSSCYNTKEQSEWCASTLCLINSPNTVIAYVKGLKNVRYFGEDPVVWNNKKWRTWVSFGENDEVVHIGKQYPYESRAIEEALIDMIKDITKKDYKVEKRGRSNVCLDTPYIMYNDATMENFTTISTLEWQEKHSKEKEVICVSTGATCCNCGQFWDCDLEFSLLCSECFKGDRCERCNSPIRECNQFCDSCYDEMIYCEDCDSYHDFEDAVEVRLVGFNNQPYYEYACYDCSNNESLYAECPACGIITHVDAMGENDICIFCEKKE